MRVLAIIFLALAVVAGFAIMVIPDRWEVMMLIAMAAFGWLSALSLAASIA